MSMKIIFKSHQSNRSGSALILTMIMCAVALAILAGVMSWSATSTKLTHRSIQYSRSIVAAEAATDKVVSQMNQDFLYGGENLVINNLSLYRNNLLPKPADSSYWGAWVFDDGNGNANSTYVMRAATVNFIALDAPYSGLNALVSTYTVASHARDTASMQDVTAGVVQQVQLATIPIFQFAMYSSGNMEISCGHPLTVAGPVHSNEHLYVEPDSTLTFASGVTAVLDVLYQRDTADGDTRGTPSGLPAVFTQTNQPVSPVAALTLPIGTTNTPEAIREIIEPPPVGEDPTSPLGRLRYYNECDLLVTAGNTGVAITSGRFNGFTTTSFSTNDVALLVSITNRFWDAREGKTVWPIDLNIGNLTTWSQTNTTIRGALALVGSNLSSVYIVDNRTLPAGSLGAVRVVNGLQLPPNGLTVATGRPLYVLGDYNELNAANLGSTNTSATRPASLVADAITFLSDSWQDSRSTNSLASRPATATTVNAALLTGVVETSPGHYSGGMENFPRFLEYWGSANISTYNGSMVKMFPSLYATNVWGQTNVYEPPSRNWTFDSNFNDSSKLPPKTPSLLKLLRHQWATVAPGQNTTP